MPSPFAQFFHRATNGRTPYPYQERFATARERPHLLRAPTGAGKTAAAVLGWLFRLQEKLPETPRRLVYCLPMRVLVEQSFGETIQWLHRLGLLDAENGFNPDDPDHLRRYRPALNEHTRGKVAVHRLMGGVEAEDWHLHPNRSAILIGTQDMLLSRALNRGYAATRFHWPMDFGLLNNDCLWVYDEPQLMGSGVSTSAQMAGLRSALGTFGPCPSVWMSATLEPGWLDTIDFRGKFPDQPLELDDTDYAPELPLYKRMTATKTLAPLGVRLAKDADDKELAVAAKRIIEKHRAGTQTLVVLNTVKRAVGIYRALAKLKHPTAKLLLVHSRFRPQEREELNRRLQEHGEPARDRILVATQVVEAGVDISAATLITELSPWASLVQRMGRCNRTGGDGPGEVYWIDLDDEKLSPPYEPEDLAFAREQVGKLAGKSVSPKALDEFKRDEQITLPFTHTHVLRRRDLLGLFDTSPDLSGNDIDIQNYVRGSDPDTDVQVFWRQWKGHTPPETEPRPRRVELCNVPVGQVRASLKSSRVGFVWDHLGPKWTRLNLDQLRPGITILFASENGGYDTAVGWTGEAKPAVVPVPGIDTDPEAGMDSDENCRTSKPRSIAAHTESVYRAVERMLPELPWLPDDHRQQLLRAARWHDLGKGHDLFQDAMRKVNASLATDTLWAKSGSNRPLRYKRKHFRHELPSALAILQHRPEWPFLVAYLAGSHHGKLRMNIRSLPGETPPEDATLPFAMGLIHGDKLPPADLGGVSAPEIVLDLTPMQFGGERSWTAQALALRDDPAMGPFRLACLEAILRATDQWVSDQERRGDEP